MKDELDIRFHYTDEKMAKELIKITPILPTDSYLEPCYGDGVFYNNVECYKKEWCEIDKGRDFFEYSGKCDWIITNPPYLLFFNKKETGYEWGFMGKMLDVAEKGIGILINLNGFNRFTPTRLEKIKNKYGMSLNKIHVVTDKRWYGRYYYLIFSKETNDVVSWNNKSF